jgi:hypothetical protein
MSALAVLALLCAGCDALLHYVLDTLHFNILHFTVLYYAALSCTLMFC